MSRSEYLLWSYIPFEKWRFSTGPPNYGGVASTSMHPYPLSLPLPLLHCSRQLSPLLFAADVIILTLIMSRGEGVLRCPYPLRCLLSPFLVALNCDCQRSLLQPPPPFSAFVAGWLLSSSSRGQWRWASSVDAVVLVGPVILRAKTETAGKQQQQRNNKMLV